MIATKSPSPSLRIPRSKPNVRRPLQPQNIIIPSNSKPQKKVTAYPPSTYGHCNKENNVCVVSSAVEVVDQSLAEELTAVKLRLERLRLDKEKIEEKLDRRNKLLDSRMWELRERGEVQREVEIEVDRLFRLKQLRVACVLSTPPIRSLREKALDEKSNEVQSESAKTEDSNGKLPNESSTSESSNMSLECSSASTSASTSSSTATSEMSKMMPRFSLDSTSNQCKT
ncbi:hypothetical protein vseg_013316 [Gypsophila vaccaria]